MLGVVPSIVDRLVVEGGEVHGVSPHDLVEQARGRCCGRVRAVEQGIDLHGGLRGLRQVHVDVGANVIAVDRDVVVVVVHRGHLQQSVLMRVGSREIVLSHLAAAAGRDRGLRVDGLVLEHHAVPVHVGIEHRVGARLRVLYLLLQVGIRGQALQVARTLRVVIEVHVVHAVHKLQHLRRRRDHRLHAGRDLHLALAAALRGHQYHAVGTLGTIEGRGRGVLHDRERGYVLRLQTGQVLGRHLHAVDQDERRGAVAEGRHTTHEEVGIVLARLTAALIADHTGYAAGQRVGQVRRRCLQLSRVDGLDRAYHRVLLLLGEGHHHRLLQRGLVLAHHHVDGLARAHSLLHRGKADVREAERVGCLGIHGILAVDGGRRAASCLSRDQHADAWQRGALGVNHQSFHDSLPLCRQHLRRQQCHEGQHHSNRLPSHFFRFL